MLRLPEADPLGACCTRGLRPHMKGNFRPHRLHLSAGCNHMHSIKARGCRAYIVQLPAAAAKSEALVGSLRRHLQSTRRKQPCTTPSSRRRSLAAACGSNSNDHSTAALLGTEKAAVMTRKQLWFAAIKPPMYTVCLIPVMVSAALAYQQTNIFAAARVFHLTAASIATIAWLNLSNDAFDATMGVDETKAESVVNLTGNRAAVLVVANIFLAVALWSFYYLLRIPGGARPMKMLGTALALGYAYQGPPFRLSYKGLGEPICLVAFGPLSIGAFYLVLADSSMTAGAAIPPKVWVASAVVGITVASVLFCSHWHQIEGDRAAGKMSPLVRIGPDRAMTVLAGIVAAPYLLIGLAFLKGWLPLLCLGLSGISLPFGAKLLKYASKHRASPEMIRPLKKYAIKWHTVLGCFLALGIVLDARMSGKLLAFF